MMEAVHQTIVYHTPEGSLPDNPKYQHCILAAMIMDGNTDKASGATSGEHSQPISGKSKIHN
jgi:hypothetical protein